MNILYRILAIDPGIENTGVAIIDVYQHKLPQLVYSDTIITKVLIKPLNDIVNSYGLRQTNCN